MLAGTRLRSRTQACAFSARTGVIPATRWAISSAVIVMFGISPPAPRYRAAGRELTAADFLPTAEPEALGPAQGSATPSAPLEIQPLAWKIFRLSTMESQALKISLPVGHWLTKFQVYRGQ